MYCSRDIKFLLGKQKGNLIGQAFTTDNVYSALSWRFIKSAIAVCTGLFSNSTS